MKHVENHSWWLAMMLLVSFASTFAIAQEFRASANTELHYSLDEPEKGFAAIFVRQSNDSMTNRFGAYWVINLLSHQNEMEYPSRQFIAAFSGAGGDTLREFLVENPETKLPIVSSLFQERRPPIQPVNFPEHRVNFGIRPFSDDNPSLFIGYTLTFDGVETVNVQARVHFLDWQKPIPELVIRVPIDSFSIGAGVRFESDEQFQTHDRTWQSEQGNAYGIRYFIGVQGPVLGGWLLISTGYPVPVTILYCCRF